jgi:hypothetical protein
LIGQICTILLQTVVIRMLDAGAVEYLWSLREGSLHDPGCCDDRDGQEAKASVRERHDQMLFGTEHAYDVFPLI